MMTDLPRAGRRDLLPLFPEHSFATPDGELAIGGVGVRDLAGRFGTNDTYHVIVAIPGSGVRGPAARRLRAGGCLQPGLPIVATTPLGENFS